MKNLLLAILLIIAPLAYISQTGCATTTQQASYKTLAITQASVAKARSAFLDQYAKGKVPKPVAARALDASQKFNASYNAAILVAKTSNAPTTPAVEQAAAAFLSVVATFIK